MTEDVNLSPLVSLSIVRHVVVSAGLLALSACSSGGGGNNNNSAPVPDADPTGVYTALVTQQGAAGPFTSSLDGETLNNYALIYDGTMVLGTGNASDNPITYIIDYEISGNTMTGTARAYNLTVSPPATPTSTRSIFNINEAVTGLTLNATVTEGSQIRGRIEGNSELAIAEFNLQYSNANQTAASLAALES